MSTLGSPGPSPNKRDVSENTADEVNAAAVGTTRSTKRRSVPWGLIIAPVGIIALSLLLARYYASLDLRSGASFQQASALDWATKLWPQTIQLITIAFWSTVLVMAISIPLGIALTRSSMRRFAPGVLGVANAGQALPAYGLLIIFLIIFGQGTDTAVYALALFALLPVLRNTIVGIDGVDQSIIEAGRGMGMTKRQALFRIELPLAVPIIVAGVRTAVIINIGMATLAFLIGGGGLGITINSGLKLQQDPVLIVGAGMVALVALTFDWLGAVAERYLKPRGL